MREMRADRLLRILITLQSRGRVTADALAESTEVSVRTIQRDMDALSAAGVPVRSLRGGGGGWELMPGYRSGLTGLTGDDAAAILAGRPPRLLEELGVNLRDDGALLKLLAALTPEARDRAEHARQRIYVDLAPWGGKPRPLEHLQRLQVAAWEDRVARIRYGGNPRSFRIEPYALVAKGTVWYVVGRARDFRTYRLDRVTHVEVMDDRFERMPDFDLEAHWHQVCDDFANALPECRVQLRLRGPATARVRWSARLLELGDPDEHGWRDAVIDTESEREALSVVLGLLPDVIVVGPSSLAAAAYEAAAAFASMAGR
jgi:predicted DNA-binding transcriptional regulator YafY